MEPRRTPPQLTEPTDVLLADVAIRIQLGPTHYKMTIERYQRISKLIERDGSPLKDRVHLFYPQGSMAIGATIASKLKTDEFDIDVVAQLDLPPDTLPHEPLDRLFEAISGEPGSRYHGKTKRRTRCVTVEYSDRMHIDVTPLIRRPETQERESWLFHDRPEAPHEPAKRLIVNPYGFAEWFKANTPPDQDFATVFEQRAAEYEQLRYEQLPLMEAAETDPVPPQEPPLRKSKAVIALQLLKRWRNVQYDSRAGRRPPSILLAKLVADAANSTDRLSEELLHQAQHMLAEVQRFHRARHRIRVVNPLCHQDLLTDRWPESLQCQAIFLQDLETLVAKLERLVVGRDLHRMKAIMVDLFGEAPTSDVFEAFNKRLGTEVQDGSSHHRPGTGSRIIAPTAGAAEIAPAGTLETKRHTFFGQER